MDYRKTRSRISESVIETIEERIITGAYLPGMRLDETSLANELSISRTPVREALNQLHAHGLIDIRPRRGAVVSDVSPLRMIEMFEVMAGLEAMCARLAARRHDDSDLRAIRATQIACERAEELGDCDLYYAENERFHMALYAASHNGFLHQKSCSLFRRLGGYRKLKFGIRGRLKKSREEHAEVVDALTAGDGALAAERIFRHVIVEGESFSDMLASLFRMKSQGNQDLLSSPVD